MNRSLRGRLLRVLADGQPRAPADLAAALSESLSSIHALREDLHSSASLQEEGETWRLAEKIDLLSEEEIVAQMGPAARSYFEKIQVLESVSSTQDVAKECSERLGSAAGHVWFAEEQTAGRGRQGRPWHSPFAANIYCSAVVDLPARQAVTGYSLAVSVAVVTALNQVGASDLFVKWPNDVLHDRGKVGGILIEACSDTELLVGIGLNVNMPAHGGDSIDQQWTDLRTVLGAPPSRNLLAARLLDALVAVTAQFREGGFAAIKDAWEALDHCRGKKVLALHDNRWLEGIARGVGEDGALLLETDSELIRCNSGSLRLL